MTEDFDLGLRIPLDHDFSGQTLGQRYKLERRIGCGGMATIYTAIDMTTKATVAVKVLHPEHDQDPVVVRRFVQEGQLVAQVRHPNLIPAYDLGWVGGRRYIVLELVDGRSLGALIKERPLPWKRSVPILLDLLAALAALHAHGVAHRDISPNNCMIETRDGIERGRLLDLGYARVIEDRGLMLTPPETSVSMIIYGSEGFIAPERLRGGRGDYHADIFSVGALWYTMLTGQSLPDPNDAEPASALGIVPLPARLRTVLHGALDIRDRRHPSAAAMAETLRAAAEDVARQQQRTRRALWLAPGLAGLILPMWLAMHASSPASPPAFATRCPPAPAAASPPSTTERDARSMASPSPPKSAADKPAADPIEPAPPVADSIEPKFDVKSEAPSTRTVLAHARFDLRAALAKCKPHPTTRLEISYDPANPLKINDEAPQGEMGRCVENMLLKHPPRRALTLRP